MKAKTSTLVLYLILGVITFSVAQVPVKQWDFRYGGTDFDVLLDARSTSDGGFILAGNSTSGISGDRTQPSQGGYDYWVVKTDGAGIKQWDARFGGNDEDYIRSVLQTSDGGFLLCGNTLSYAGGDVTSAGEGIKDYWIVKIDGAGVKQWDLRYGSTSNEEAAEAISTSDGGFLLAGSSSSNAGGDKSQNCYGSNDFWVIKIDANGVKQWDGTYGGSGMDLLRSCIQLGDDGYLLAGYSDSPVSGDKSQPDFGTGDNWVVKIDANGVKQWDQTFGGSLSEDVGRLAESPTGELYIAGISNSGVDGNKLAVGKGGLDYWIVKCDPSGTKLWDKTFGGTNDEYLTDINLSGTDILLGGKSNSGQSGDKTQGKQGKYDYWMVKADDQGNKIWDVDFGGDDHDNLSRVVIPSTGTYLLVGSSSSAAIGDKSQPCWGNNDYWILKATELPTLSENKKLSTGFEIFPNPVSALAVIQFSLAQFSHVYIKILSPEGKEVMTIANEIFAKVISLFSLIAGS